MSTRNDVQMKLSDEPWPTLTEYGFRAITSNPEFLFEGWGGPVLDPPEIVVARLYGYDENLVHEWRLDAPVSVLYVPLAKRSRVIDPILVSPNIAVREFHLRSGWSRQQIAVDLLAGMGQLEAAERFQRPNFCVQVLCVRYVERASGGGSKETQP